MSGHRSRRAQALALYAEGVNIAAIARECGCASGVIEKMIDRAVVKGEVVDMDPANDTAFGVVDWGTIADQCDAHLEDLRREHGARPSLRAQRSNPDAPQATSPSTASSRGAAPGLPRCARNDGRSFPRARNDGAVASAASV